MLIGATIALGAVAGFLGGRTQSAPAGRPGRVLTRAASALLGGVGAAVAVVMLRGCAWMPGIESTQAVLGTGIAVVTGWGLSRIGAYLIDGRGESPLGGDTHTATFRLGWWWPALLLTPTLVILAMFLYRPALETFSLSTQLVRLGAPRSVPVCLSHISELLTPNPAVLVGLPLAAVALTALLRLWKTQTSPVGFVGQSARLAQPLGALALLVALYYVFSAGPAGYRSIYFNTMVISVGTVLLSMVLGLTIANLAFKKVRGITVYRMLLIWPYAISPPVAGILFAMILDPLAGVTAHVLDIFGVAFPNYRSDPTLARTSIVVASTWKVLGYNILFYLAGLQTVRRDLLEAAAIDGATPWQRFRHMVLPALGPITFFLLITNLTYVFFDIYGTIEFMTAGAPAGATSVSIYEIIRVGVGTGDLGRGAAQSVLLFVAVIALTVWQFRRSRSSVALGGAA